jgi:ABC-2 type transport system ATP-binding protein
MPTIIETEALTKRYGSLTALDNLTLSVEQGAVVGFIGPNGAGKTTTMRILTTLLRPTSGSARVAGHDVLKEPDAVRRTIGYMPDFFGVYEEMKVWEYLDFFGEAYGIPATTRRGMVDDLLALVDLGHKKEAFVESLSRGMKQRLCLARTLAHDPQVLILDEPASGLDPRARIEMRELLLELRRMGKTIFFSSHILSEIADICTEIAVLEAGRLVAHGDLATIQQRLRGQRLIRMRLLGDAQQGQAALLPLPAVSDVMVDGQTVTFGFSADDTALTHLLAHLVAQGLPVLSFTEEQGNIEDLFMQLTEGIVQ